MQIFAFLYQIVKLAAVRINGMIERLEKQSQNQQLRESVYCLFQKILNQRTSLFFSRHIDQLILCSFYGVAKVCVSLKTKSFNGLSHQAS